MTFTCEITETDYFIQGILVWANLEVYEIVDKKVVWGDLENFTVEQPTKWVRTVKGEIVA
jgi:hypothetical protein